MIDDRPPVDTPVDAPVVQAMLAGHLAATGTEAVIGGVPGATDGTILTRDAGLATVVYGPGGKWIAHQADEYRRGGGHPTAPARTSRRPGISWRTDHR